MKYWEAIADKLSAAGWSWGYCSAVTQHGWRWIVDAHKNDSRRYIVESDELLSAFLELETTLLCNVQQNWLSSPYPLTKTRTSGLFGEDHHSWNFQLRR